MTTPKKKGSEPGARAAASADSEGLTFATEAARLVRDDKCDDVVLLDVRDLSQVSDFIIIGSGTSDRQMHSALRHVEELGKGRGMPAYRSSADDRSTWLLIDFVDVVVHLFEPNTRAHYDLEMLWGDAPRLEWERPDQVRRDRAGLNA
jgi:ribosome-associated protein